MPSFYDAFRSRTTLHHVMTNYDPAASPSGMNKDLRGVDETILASNAAKNDLFPTFTSTNSLPDLLGCQRLMISSQNLPISSRYIP